MWNLYMYGTQIRFELGAFENQQKETPLIDSVTPLSDENKMFIEKIPKIQVLSVHLFWVYYIYIYT